MTRPHSEQPIKLALAKFFEEALWEFETPIAQIHSTGFAEDGQAFTVMVDMVGGRELMFTFRPGANIAVKWLNEPEKEWPPTQHARLRLFAG